MTKRLVDRVAVQDALAASRRRGAEIADLLIAAAAESVALVVLHHDRDVDLVAEVTGRPVEWSCPPAPCPDGAWEAGGMSGFLGAAADGEGARRLYEEDLEGDGFVMNLTRVWAHVPDLQVGLSALLGRAAEEGGLTFRQRGVLVLATASTLGDSYCALAWGTRLAGEVGAEVAAAVIVGDDGGLGPADAALARWARQVARDPNATTRADVEPLRAAGFDDAQILAITAYVALRLAFSTVNDALGALPDAELAAAAPAEVLAAVDFGRRPDEPSR